MPDVQIHSLAVGLWRANAYAIVCTRTGASVLVDPGAEPDRILGMLEGARPLAILLTHSHSDHVGALEEVRGELAVPVLAHDGPHAEGSDLQLDRTLKDGEQISFGDFSLKIYHCPGHTYDQISIGIVSDYRILVGDTLFEGGPGKTWSPSSFQTTLITLKDVVLSWPDSFVCHPGHGDPFRLGDIRQDIESFLAKDHGSFFGDATWDMVSTR